MNTLRKLHRSLSFNIIATIVLVLIFFSAIVTTIGYLSFSDSLQHEYNETTFSLCDTAATLINTDRLEDYLAVNGNDEEYQLSQKRMDVLCEKMNVSLIYVIQVDTSDYGSFTSIFNSVNDNTDYTRWDIGYRRKATNDEYKQIYERLYTKQSQRESIFRTKNLDGAPPHITSLISLENSQGDVVAVLCIQRPMTALEEGRRPYMISVAVTVVLTAFFVAYIVLRFFLKNVTKPIRVLKEEAKRFAAENTVSERDALANLSRIDDIEILASSIRKMEKDTLNYIDTITAATSERERIGAELDVASKIQEDSIPTVFPAFPERKEFDIYASMTPAKEVGGDFYDFFFLDEEHLVFTIADVSGKGIPAALFMMVTQILIKEKSTITGGTPAEILEFVNNRICDNNNADMFVTVWLGIMNIHTGKITAANAGHDDPAVYRSGSGFGLLKTKHGLVIGAVDNCKYTNYDIQLHPGDKIFLYTDGVPEATNADNKMFTPERMLVQLNKVGDKSPQEVIAAVKAGVDEYVGDSPQFDDLTMLCVEYKGGDSALSRSLHIEADTENLDAVNDFLDNFLNMIECPKKVQMQIALAAEEIFTNIASYAYAPEKGYADIRIDCADNRLCIAFEDSGIPYNPLEKKDPDITLKADERKIGGLGIFMTKKLMDEVEYVYEDGKNILKLIKKL